MLEDFITPTSADAAKAGQPDVINQILEGDCAVANREQKGNREKRKPKAEKPKSPVQASPFARPPATVGAKKKK